MPRSVQTFNTLIKQNEKTNILIISFGYIFGIFKQKSHYLFQSNNDLKPCNYGLEIL